MNYSSEVTWENPSSTTILDEAVYNEHYVVNMENTLSVLTDMFIIAMFPSIKGSSLFNEAGRQEWQIRHDTETTFVIYGMHVSSF